MNIIRLYNQNRKQLFIVILIVASIILTIHFVNYLVKKDNKENLNNGTSSSSTSSATTTYNPQQSAISSSTVSDKKYKEDSNIIDKFIKYCNEGNIQDAYNLLSTACKEIEFPTLEYFINNYYKEIFKENRLYTIKNWTGSTYKINITENMLATGEYHNGISIEDYFTIVTENGSKKLNINGFIRKNEMKKSNSKNNLEIQVICEYTYMDYVIYSVKAKNKTSKTILLDSGETTQNLYIVDNNNVKYMSYRNEIPSAELKILPNSENELKIKYSSMYTKDRRINSLIFNDIILDYEEYNDCILKGNYINRASIKVEI